MPKLEEIQDFDDIDDLDMDLAEFDPTLSTPIAPKRPEPTIVRSQDEEDESTMMKFMDPVSNTVSEHAGLSKRDMEELKHLQLLYPCYFDKNRTRKQGRRVSSELAVENPLAKTISDAVRSLQMTCVLETDKQHPQDYGNPGRVRVYLKYEGKSVSVLAGNKRELMNHVARYLKKHETTLESVMDMPYAPDLKQIKPEVLPRVKGFKMNTMVPLHSAYTLKHPMTKDIYEKRVEVPAVEESEREKKKMQKMKHKVMRVRR